MTDKADRYEYFRPVKSGSERIADAEAAWDPTPPPDPETIDWKPTEVAPGYWKTPGDARTFRSEDDARRAGLSVYARAQRDYANYVNALIVPAKTPGQEEAEEYEAAKAKAIAEGVSSDAWNNSPDVRAKYLPDSRTGAELWEEHKRKNHMR
ncbi:hypothetical protein [Pseudarthrobacter phenanthrenivorans]|uniref:hypothetical protein n=1 Tax=Pseudarthrobacter phenanthrenivorans TaxID=361575 RepID=UPI002F35661E